MVEKISRVFFALSLVAIISALLFSLTRKPNLAEQAGVATYICMTVGVILMVIDEMKNEKKVSQTKAPLKRKKKLQKRSV